MHRLKAALCLLIIALPLGGCGIEYFQKSPSFHYPDPSAFTAEINISRDTVKVNESILVQTSLVNHSAHAYTIHHGAPLVLVEVANHSWKDLLPKIDIPIDQEKKLQPGEVYDPDTDNFVDGERRVSMDTAGYFSLTAVARFWIFNPVDGSEREYDIRSKPVYVEVTDDTSDSDQTQPITIS